MTVAGRDAGAAAPTLWISAVQHKAGQSSRVQVSVQVDIAHLLHSTSCSPVGGEAAGIHHVTLSCQCIMRQLHRGRQEQLSCTQT